MAVTLAVPRVSVMNAKWGVVHNTVRGAAGVAILNAELMHAEGMLQ